MTLARYRQLAIMTTVGICVLVVAGGAVRLTGSGLGCDDWPSCNNERFIDVSTGHAAIEQLNRLLSGLIGLPTLLLAVASFRAAPRGSGLRWPAIGVLVSVLANGVVGGMAVLEELHPALVASHFLLAVISIAFGLICIRASSGAPIEWARWTVRTRRGALTTMLLVSTAGALVTGTVVTGAGPHAGEEDVRRFGFDIGSVARVHSVTVIVAVLTGVLLAWTVARQRDRKLQNALSTWMFIALVQGGIGYVQYFTGVPGVLVGLHIFGATVLWVMTVRLVITDLDAGTATAKPTLNTMDIQHLVV
jgi:cytochrome c oxidase assembly protein subunit 15